MVDLEASASTQRIYMQCTDHDGQLDSITSLQLKQELIGSNGISSLHPKQELTDSNYAELAIGAASAQAVVLKKGDKNDAVVYVKSVTGDSIATLCVQGASLAGKTAKDNQNEALKQGIKCEEEINSKVDLEKIPSNKTAVCKGIISLNNNEVPLSQKFGKLYRCS